ncbi:RodZ domain-containing protein, partial [Commensalibacter sp. Nvir]|uniref:helix-turn-helix domain-containing protein n=1 Tax=Commensalibacter sp. Nvir TaxID=3069817 RepID=UPI0030C84F62
MSEANRLQSGIDSNFVGEAIKNRRIELGLSLEEISRRLCIRQSFLEAIEAGQIDKLPSGAYASGFLRAYAEFMELDADELVRRFREENQKNHNQPKLMFPAPVPQSGVPAGVMVFFSLLLVIGVYIGWYKMSDHHKVPEESIPLVPTKHVDQNKTVMSPQIASVMSNEQSLPVSLSSNNPSVEKNIDLKKVETQVEAKAPLSKPIFTPQSLKQADSTVNSVDKNSFDNAQSENVKKHEDVNNETVKNEIKLKAFAPSWVAIKDAQHRLLFQKIMKADEEWVFPKDNPELIVTIGNPSAIVLVNGERISQPLGQPGKVLRNFKIDKNSIDKLLSDHLFSHQTVLM